jgi:hypothetical protein
MQPVLLRRFRLFIVLPFSFGSETSDGSISRRLKKTNPAEHFHLMELQRYGGIAE